MLRNLVWTLGAIVTIVAAEVGMAIGFGYLAMVVKLDMEGFRAAAFPLHILDAAIVLVVVTAVKAINTRWGFVYCLLVPALLTALAWVFNPPAGAYLGWAGWRCLNMVCAMLGFLAGGYFGSRHGASRSRSCAQQRVNPRAQRERRG